MDDETVTRLPVKFRNPPEAGRTLLHPWEVAKQSQCNHLSFVIDEKKMEVECATCGERMNPMWVLHHLASRDRQFKENQRRSQELMAKVNERTRTKCDHCGKMTRIRGL
jgi:Zn finger protein HypA/HybF involved in hydrogenase expression